MTIACVARRVNGRLAFQTLQTIPKESITGTFVTPDPVSDGIVVPAPSSIQNDQVYKGDGSPDFATFKFTQRTVTYAVVTPKAGVMVNIPLSHNIVVAVKDAFQTFRWFVDQLRIQFVYVPYDINKPADITIKVDANDPIFINDKNVMAYCHYPNTTPIGQFTCVINPAYNFSLDGRYNFASDFNQTIRHELGHGIGCVHTSDPNDIMYPFYNAKKIPTKMDIWQYQNMYGSRKVPNWVLRSWYIMDYRLFQYIIT